jgi:hypothetical protein
MQRRRQQDIGFLQVHESAPMPIDVQQFIDVAVAFGNRAPKPQSHRPGGGSWPGDARRGASGWRGSLPKSTRLRPAAKT